MTAMIALLALMLSGGIEGGGEQPDCEKLPQAVKEQEDRYWKVYMGQLKGDELAEGAKLDQLTTKLKSCPPKPKTSAPKSTSNRHETAGGSNGRKAAPGSKRPRGDRGQSDAPRSLTQRGGVLHHRKGVCPTIPLLERARRQ